MMCDDHIYTGTGDVAMRSIALTVDHIATRCAAFVLIASYKNNDGHARVANRKRIWFQNHIKCDQHSA